MINLMYIKVSVLPLRYREGVYLLSGMVGITHELAVYALKGKAVGIIGFLK